MLKKANRRITVLYVIFILGILVLFIRFIYLQIVKGEELKQKAYYQQIKKIKLASKRGLIVDRNGYELAIDIKSYSLYAQPLEFKLSPAEIANKLAPILNENIEDILNKLKGKHFRWIKRKFDDNTAKKIRELKIEGLGLIEESKRIYPNKNLASNLLGFTGIDNQGLSGIELSFEYFLRGGLEQAEIITDAQGYEVFRRSSQPLLYQSKQANKVYLTIDKNIQYVAEREIAKGVQEQKAIRGAAIVIDVKTGEIYALATYPNYDPNNITNTQWQNIKNWVVTDFYEPGSTLKLFTILAALEDKKVSINDTITCPGAIKVQGWTVHDHGVSPSEVRNLTLNEIIKYSSNVGCSIIGRRMNPAVHRNLLYNFGFGRLTYSSLAGEVKGILPELPWQPVRQSTISFGQGIAVTPLQIAVAGTAIANQGYIVQPRIINKIVSPQGKLIYKFYPIQKKIISTQTANAVLKMVEDVVEGEGGTGFLGKIPGYRLGGKTGTADKVVNGRYTGDVYSSFLGIVTIDNPKLIVFVILDSPQKEHFASVTVVPIFRNITNYIIRYFNIMPSKPEELNKNKIL